MNTLVATDTDGISQIVIKGQIRMAILYEYGCSSVI